VTEQERPPLFELFTRLQKAGIALGIGEYKLMLTALEGGFGVTDLEALANLCKSLWIRSNDEQRTFDRVFQEITQIERDPLFPGDNLVEDTRPQDTRSPSGPLADPLPSQADASRNSLERAEQEVQAVLHMRADERTSRRFERSDEYFPITRRQMKQSWRYLRHPIRQGRPTELNIEKTIEEIGRNVLLFEPIFLPRYTNRAEVLLLIDQGGSMVPFHQLSARLAETARYEGRLTNINVYYFRNYPTSRLFRTPSLQDDVPVKEVLEGMHYDHSSVLIFSDAGAARGYFSRRRFEGTKSFLDQLTQHVRYQAWLNPMPSERWPDTTAQSIQQFIPMFDISRRGLEYAINILRGRSAIERIA